MMAAKERKKVVDTCMKAAAKKQIKLASYTEDRNKQKAYLRRNYKQVRAYFQYLKF